MKSFLIRDKNFLRQLYDSPSKTVNNRILTFAADIKLNTLIRLLHFISNGEITIKKSNFDIINSAGKLRFIKRNVEKKCLVKTLTSRQRKKAQIFKTTFINLRSITVLLL